METSGYRLLLPEGTLDYFIISDVKESSTEIVIYLEEKNEVPGEYSQRRCRPWAFCLPASCTRYLCSVSVQHGVPSLRR